MSANSEQHLVELAARVLRRVTTERERSAPPPVRTARVAPGSGPALSATVADIARAVEGILGQLRELGVSVAESQRAPAVPAPVLSGAAVYGAGAVHPSQERFGLPSELNEFVEYLESRPCSIEPGKPCVDCGACETRGF